MVTRIMNNLWSFGEFTITADAEQRKFTVYRNGSKLAVCLSLTMAEVFCATETNKIIPWYAELSRSEMNVLASTMSNAYRSAAKLERWLAYWRMSTSDISPVCNDLIDLWTELNLALA